VTCGCRWPALFLAGVLVGSACTTSSSSDVRAAAVYQAIVLWFDERREDDPDQLPVFVEARGEGARIDLAVQAELIDLTADDATVRFIDSREEAIVEDVDDTDEGPSVRDDGVLIRLDPVLEEGSAVTVAVDEYVGEETMRTLRFRLTSSGDDAWRVVDEPTEVPSP
jgi:hypothetical protein